MNHVETLTDCVGAMRPNEGAAAYRSAPIRVVRCLSWALRVAMLACLTIVLSGLTVAAFAAEARCGQLGGNCVCSEPLNTTNFVRINPSWYNPADSTSKECNAEGIPGGAIARNVNDVFGDNNAAAMAALPSGRSITHFMRGPEGHLGIFSTGHGHHSDTFMKRLAARFYIYHSPNFQFAQEGACTNAKFMQFTGPHSLVDMSFGPIHMYNFTEFSPAQDCCFVGPGPDQGRIDKSYWRGKWVRAEAIYTNRAGPGWRFQLYLRNITDNGPEYLVVDTAATGTQLNSSNRMPPQRQDVMHINGYRETGCAGWRGFSHYIMAGWDTDTGQRIGAASEIEGGGSGGTPQSPPAAPTNPKISLSDPQMLLSGFSPIVLLVGTVAGLVLVGRKRRT